MTKKLSTRDKFLRGMKRGGYDADERTKYWDNQQKEIAKARKELEDRMKKEEFGGMVGGSPINNVGDGNIAGLGIGKQGEPGVNPKKKKNVMPFGMFVRKKSQ
jgi:hypothetical protein